MQELIDAIERQPLESWIPVLALSLAGLAVWLAGGRLLRPIFAAAGLAAGAAGGLLVAQHVELGVPAWGPVIVGALLMACLATLAYRVAVAAALALVLAAASAAGVWSSAPPQARMQPLVEIDSAPPPEDPLQPFIDRVEALLRGREGAAAAAQPQPEEPAPTPQTTIESARALGEELAAAARSMWDGTPPQLRDRLIGAALVGGLAGFLLGTLANTLSAWIVTAFAGALMAMAGAWSAAARLDMLDEGRVPQEPRMWLGAWMIASVIGLAIQWMTRPKRADKAA